MANGDLVRMTDGPLKGRLGTVLEVDGDHVHVAVGSLRCQVGAKKVEVVQRRTAPVQVEVHWPR
jgi:ribosomal protein L24